MAVIRIHDWAIRCQVAVFLLLGLSLPLCAQTAAQALNEQVVMYPKRGALFPIKLETTIYRPPGDGPFPLVVINHGKSLGDTRFQPRYQPVRAARFFVQRGYAVVVPMRQGFSKSEGSYIGGGCNVESNGVAQAEDVTAVLDAVAAQPWADKSRILMLGQSHGGWTALALGTLAYPGMKGIVNFAGGLRQPSCAAWEHVLGRAAGAYGAKTQIPSLWFYGDNDSFFSPFTFQMMHKNYVASGGRAELIAFGDFGSDAHFMFSSNSGAPIWQPRVLDFMRGLDLPTDVVWPGLGDVTPMVVPPPTNFADVTDVEKVPHLRDGGREAYRKFLTQSPPRAFALSPGGAWGWAQDGDDPLARALENCNRHAKEKPCRWYAVDDQTVWLAE